MISAATRRRRCTASRATSRCRSCANGAFFGTLCAIDPRPAKLKTPQTIGMFKLFADLIGLHLEAQERLASSEAALLERAGGGGAARAVHRRAGARPAQSAGLDPRRRTAARQGARSTERARTIVGAHANSVRRMAGLIDNVLDFARGRLGGGLSSNRNADEPLAPALDQVVAELRLAGPTAQIDADIELTAPVDCDRPRIAQLLSNLLANALTHGAARRRSACGALTGDGTLRAVGRQPGRADPARRARAAVRAVRPCRRTARPAGAGPRALHRRRDRPRPRRHADGDLGARRHALRTQDSGAVDASELG